MTLIDTNIAAVTIYTDRALVNRARSVIVQGGVVDSIDCPIVTFGLI